MIRDYLIFFTGVVGGLLDSHVPSWTLFVFAFGVGFVINLTRKD